MKGEYNKETISRVFNIFISGAGEFLNDIISIQEKSIIVEMPLIMGKRNNCLKIPKFMIKFSEMNF